MIHIPSSEIKQPQLHADTLGFTFVWHNHFLRGIYPESVSLAKSYFETGFIKEVTERGVFPRTWVSEFENEQFGLIIEHEMISPALYATEWNFSMLKEAALMVLNIAHVGWKYGYNMIDCHKLNVMFKGLNPVYVDLGSFVPRGEDCTGWHPYMNFMASYYYILKMWADGAVQLAKRMMAPGVELNAMDYYIYKAPINRFSLRITSLKILLITNLCYLSSQPTERIINKMGVGPSGLKAKLIRLCHWGVRVFKPSPSQHIRLLRRRVEKMMVVQAKYREGESVNTSEVYEVIKRLNDVKTATFIDSPTKVITKMCNCFNTIISIQQDSRISNAEYHFIRKIKENNVISASFFLGNGAILVRGKYPEDRLASDIAIVLDYKIPSESFGLHNAMIFFNQCKMYSESSRLIVNIPQCSKEDREELLKTYFTDAVGDTFYCDKLV